jgi:tRNA(Ile)-lysidine synthase
MLPVNRFLSFVELNKLFKRTDKILLAVSGGKDSVLMTHLFNETGFAFGIAHCNFKLRGDESDRDEDFTHELAQQVGAPFFSTTFNTRAFVEEHKISVQMAARQLRYDWFEQIRDEYNYDYIALAHHQSDTTETVLLNLVRGTGIAGLHGILPKRQKLIRPLLFLKREEIDTLITENKFPYREDSSNSSTKYARNKLRIDVIPKLKEINPHLEETFETNSRRFKELEDFLKFQTEQLRFEIFKILPSGDASINIEDLKKLQPKSLLLYELFKPYNFSEAVLEDLEKSWDRQPGKVFESATHSLLLDRMALILSPKTKAEPSSISVPKGESDIKWGQINVKVKELDSGDFKLSRENCFAFFDEALLQFPLKLRHWNKGDYFYPFGMKGKKKLSDFFTEKKIPLNAKNSIPILENGNGDVLWIAGYRSDDRYKITEQTKKVIIFEIQKQQ